MTCSNIVLGLWAVSAVLCMPLQAQASGVTDQRPFVSADAWTFALAVRSDGERIAAARYAGEVVLLDPQDGHVLTTLQPALSAQPWALAFAPDGEHLAALAQDGSLRVWSLADNEHGPPTATEPIEIVPPVEERNRRRVRFQGALSWSPSSKRLLVGDQGGQVRLVSAEGKILASWTIAGKLVGRLHAWSTDSQRFYIADGSVVEVRAAHDAAILKSDHGSGLIDCGDPISTMAIQPFGDLLATGHPGSRLRLWRLKDGDLHFEKEYPDDLFPTDGDCVADVAFSPTGKRLAFSTTESVFIRIIDPNDGRPLVKAIGVGAHFGERVRIAWSPSGEHLWFNFECGNSQLGWLPTGESSEVIELGMFAVPFFGGNVGVVLRESELVAFELDGTRRW